MLSNDSSARTRCVCNCSYRSVEAITRQIGPVVRTSITGGGSGGTTCLPESAAFRGCVGCRWKPGNSELATIDCRAGVSDTP